MLGGTLSLLAYQIVDLHAADLRADDKVCRLAQENRDVIRQLAQAVSPQVGVPPLISAKECP